MTYTPLTISDFKQGLEKDKDEFILMNDAFSNLENAYVWRGKIVKKRGHKSLGPLQRDLTDESLGNTVAGAFSGNIRTLLSLESGSRIIPGSVTITVDSGGANEEIFTEPSTPDGTLEGDGSGTGTINYASNAVTLTENGAGWTVDAVIVTLRYAPTLSVMGLFVRELSTLNVEDTIAFDTKYCYRYNNTNERFEELLAGTTWQGSDSNFFSILNYYQNANGDLFWATNFLKSISSDPIRYYDTSAWNTFAPAVDGSGNEIHQARFLKAFKGRLLAFNTYEGATLAASTQYSNRLRFSWVGDPLDATAFRSDTAGKGGYIDAPTNQQIVSVDIVKDIIIVGFERSIWKVRYTGNEILPFVWERINNDLGVESSFSSVSFDKGIMAIGQNAVISCNGFDVERVDTKIPDEVLKFHNGNNGLLRVHGIRDLNNQLVYWCYPLSASNGTYPNRILCYNYSNDTYAIFRDSFTAFGDWQNFDDITWADLSDVSWEDYQKAWSSGSLQSAAPEVLGGNVHGEVVVLNDRGMSDGNLVITAVASGNVRITSPNHNLENDDFVHITDVIGLGSDLNGNTYKVSVVSSSQIDILTYDSDTDTFIPKTITAGPTYLGNGKLALVNNMKVRSKRFNMIDQGSRMYLGYLDFLCGVTSEGEITINVFTDDNNSEPINDDNEYLNNIISTQIEGEEQIGRDKILHRLFCHTAAQNFQFEITLSDIEMIDDDINSSNVEVSAVTLWSRGGGRITL